MKKTASLIVKGVDTLMGAQPVEIEADMVVLATAGVSNEGAEELAQRLHVSYDPYKFFCGSASETETGRNQYGRNLRSRSLPGAARHS